MAARICYVLPHKLGGVATLSASVIRRTDRSKFETTAVLTHCDTHKDTTLQNSLGADREITFRFRQFENRRKAEKRLRAVIGEDCSLLVCNDWLELSMVAACGFPGKVIHVVHGDYDYYYDLAERFAPYVDAFVAVSRQIYKELARRVPSRVDSIHQIPCGVQPAPPVLPRPSKAPLRVLYVGRLHEGKGVFDLPLIDAAIRRNHLSVSWTLVGDGPAAAELRRRWSEDHVRFLGALNHDAVLQEYSKHDVFILPTRAEGFPLTLLEAMSAGLVPVVSDLPSGIPEVVQDSTGFRVLPGEIDGFAEKISRLARSPEVLKALGAEARNKIHRGFTIEQVADRYNELFHRCYMSKARPAAAPLLSGNYLDRIWIPNPLVLGLRSFNALRPSLLKRRWQAFRKRREQLQLSVQDGYAYRVNTQQHA